jgi:hypothetical protein
MHSCPSLSHSTQIRAAMTGVPTAVAPDPCACRLTLTARPPHRDSDAPASVHVPRSPHARQSRPGLRPGCCAPTSTAPAASASIAPQPPPRPPRPGLRCLSWRQSSGLRFGHRSPVLRHPRHQARPDSDAPTSDPPPPRHDSDAPTGARPPPCPDVVSRSSSTPGR